MENVQVVFATKTQHSRKIAEGIAQALGTAAVNIEEHPQPEQAGLLFLVGGIYGGKCNPVLLAYAEKLTASLVGRAVLVTSSVSVSHRSQKELREVLVEKGIAVADELTCTGALLFLKVGHPSKSDIETLSGAAKAIQG